jgi:hypothetical protein
MDVGFITSYDSKSTTGDGDAVQYGVAVAIPIGQGAIRVVPEAENWMARRRNRNGASKMIGYDYRLSKRTQVGFGYAKIDNDPAAVFTWTGAPPNQTGTGLAPPAGSDPEVFFVSVIHRF